MTMTSGGKLHPIAKWSLIIGPLLVFVFNFLLPTVGASPMDPQKSGAYIAKLGGDAELAKIYIVVILLGIILYTRAIVGLYQAAPEGAAKLRLGVGALGSVAALGVWGIVLGLGLAEASVAKDVVDATAAAQAGVAGMAEKAGSATLIATTLHAGFFGVYQIATYVAYISLIPIGGGLAVSGIVRKEFGWLIIALGVVTVVLTSIMPVNTESGMATFGVMALIWTLVFVVMGLMIAKDDMN